MTHICVGKQDIIVSSKDLSIIWTIIWTNAGILATEPLGTNFIEIFFQENAYGKDNSNMTLILFRPWHFHISKTW